MINNDGGGINTSPFRMKTTRAKTQTARQKLTQQQMKGAQRRASVNKAPRGR